MFFKFLYIFSFDLNEFSTKILFNIQILLLHNKLKHFEISLVHHYSLPFAMPAKISWSHYSLVTVVYRIMATLEALPCFEVPCTTRGITQELGLQNMKVWKGL
jgi:hypothetical protein